MLPSDEEMITETLETINQLPVAMGRRVLRIGGFLHDTTDIAYVLGIPGFHLVRTLIFARTYPRNKHKALYDKYPELMK